MTGVSIANANINTIGKKPINPAINKYIRFSQKLVHNEQSMGFNS